MAKLSKQKVTVFIIIAIIACVAGLKFYQLRQAKTVDSVMARSKGAEGAKVKIVEFIDFQCPACAFGSNTLKGYLERHPKDIHLQVKYFPLIKSHRHAMQSALYSECAGVQGKFWDFHYLLMPSQKQWSFLLSADAFFQDLARQVGLNMPALNSCLSSDEASKTINEDRALGQSLGVQSTPSYFVNNKLVVGAKALEDELKGFFEEK